MNAASRKPTTGRVWALCGLLSAAGLFSWGLELVRLAPVTRGPELVAGLVWGLLPVAFPLVAGMILAAQPRNVIGWLLLAPAFVLALGWLANNYLARLPQAPVLTLPLWLLIWFASWVWLPLIFPLALIPLFFPTGRPPGPRWNWVAVAVGLEALIFILMATFVVEMTPVGTDATWSVPNPIGFLSNAQVEAVIGLWIAALLALILLCVASLFVRYRRAGAVERTQIRWLLFACAFFALVYVSADFLPVETATGERTPFGYVWDLFFIAAILTIPAAIAVAILRYRLWDIDVIIRRTLIYSALTGILALAYFGSVLVLQGLFRALTGQGQNSLVVVLSTLAIAALFGPVRGRLQTAIDRRFYRRKYDAARTLAGFALAARNQVDLDTLSAELVDLVDATMQPAQVSLWLKPPVRPEKLSRMS